ncbi:MAG TPA: tetratricopeptide repeat protein [Opitutaceae bacterium]|nr:tetratricopeptide repeat protein [Opitutaceae bacterium]
MPEVTVQQLDSRLQKLVENARISMDRGNFEYAIEMAQTVLGREPGCLAVRKLLRAAQMQHLKSRNRFFAKALGGVTGAGAIMAGSSALKKEPMKALDAAEKALAADPTSVSAQKLLGQAASALGLHETAVFAWETVRDLQPDSREHLLALGDAYVAAGRHGDAVKIADELLKRNSVDPEAQALLKHASVAHSIDRGNWQSASGSYRDKLKDEAQAVSLEQASKVVATGDMTLRLLSEAEARAAREPGNLNHIRDAIQAHRELGNHAAALDWLRKARAIPAGAADPALERLETDLHEAELEARINAGGDPTGAHAAELAAFRLAGARAMVERYPNDHDARYRLGALHYEADEFDAAIAQFQAAQRGPKVRLQALAGLGACFQAKGLLDLAIVQYEAARAEVSAMDETKKHIIYQLARCHELMGAADKAIAEFKLIYAADIGYADVAGKINDYYAQRR